MGQEQEVILRQGAHPGQGAAAGHRAEDRRGDQRVRASLAPRGGGGGGGWGP